ncbi:hypothetical protein ACO0KY_03320 [Undibacterium sp. Dicai25W]
MTKQIVGLQLHTKTAKTKMAIDLHQNTSVTQVALQNKKPGYMLYVPGLLVIFAHCAYDLIPLAANV